MYIVHVDDYFHLIFMKCNLLLYHWIDFSFRLYIGFYFNVIVPFTWNLLSKNTVTCSYCRYIIYFHRHCKRTCTIFWQRCNFDLLIWQCYASRHHAGNTVLWYVAWLFVCLEVCNSLLLWQGSINGFIRAAEVGKLNIIFYSHRHVHTKYLK